MRSLLDKIIRSSRLVLAGGMVVALSGCAMIWKSTGDILVTFGEAEMAPYLFTYDDIRMGCMTGEAQTPLLMSFAEVGSWPEKLGVLTFTTAAVCMQQQALEEELRYHREVRAGNVSSAQDARIAQKRLSAVAAKRLYKAYTLMNEKFGPLEEGQCPYLRKDLDELVWLVGNISGVQALVADGAADGTVGVPRDIVAKVERRMKCLDNEKWWGAPMGVRATIWSILPQLAPEGAEPWKVLHESEQMGFEQGVRLGSAFYAMSAYSKGDNERLRDAIRNFAANGDNVDPQYMMMDTIAGVLVTGLSDLLWTENTGKRTPIGALGTFWDDEPEESEVDIDDLL
ncbi:hypothetical protein [Alloalcanivorax gelatiniphagus]|uniref:Uncharacterized protein n=2 Tax=Alloalcanivorax gelatiniphagus TaxID=1194167 RepID=A0ABY2XN90_9GAMM|nr:hypothetical protein FGS76_07510 [Alloalcanivorax gelatiniphagus]